MKPSSGCARAYVNLGTASQPNFGFGVTLQRWDFTLGASKRIFTQCSIVYSRCGEPAARVKIWWSAT